MRTPTTDLIIIAVMFFIFLIALKPGIFMAIKAKKRAKRIKQKHDEAREKYLPEPFEFNEEWARN